MAELSERIAAFLAAHTTMTLATVGPDGPAAAAVFYAHDDAFSLYFLSEERTEHGRNVLAHPQAAAAIHADGQDWRVIRGLQVRGIVRPVATGSLAHAAAVYGRKYAFVAGLLVASGGPGLLSSGSMLAGPLAKARFWALQPSWFRLIDNTVRFGFKEEWMPGDATETD
jgi:hypothetical protein